MKTLLFLLSVSSSTVAADFTIVDVRRNIPLSDNEPVVKDFYIDAGSDDGMKKNLVVSVYRPTNIRGANGAQSFGEINIPVGQLQIVTAYPKLSVAREYKLFSRDENPMLEQIGIMNGDKIETKNSFVGRRPQSEKKTAEMKPLIEEVTPLKVTPEPTPTPVPVAAELLVTPLPVKQEEPNPVNNTEEAPKAPESQP